MVPRRVRRSDRRNIHPISTTRAGVARRGRPPTTWLDVTRRTPDAFELNDGIVPEGLEDKARRAVANCPEYAISITERPR
jgi:hypothetical protein